MNVRAILEQAAQFLKDIRPGAPIMSDALLLQTLCFHALRGTLAIVWDGARIAGIAIAYKTMARRIQATEHTQETVFNWVVNPPEGDAVYLALVAAQTPKAMRPLAQWFTRRFPDWSGLPQLTHRHGKLKTYRHLLERLAGQPEGAAHG